MSRHVSSLEIQTVLSRLQPLRSHRGQLSPVRAMCAAEEVWRALPRQEQPALFELLDLAAGLPRDAARSLLEPLASNIWPELESALENLEALQILVDHPVVPPGATLSRPHDATDLEDATTELTKWHCTTIDFFFMPDERDRLDLLVAELAARKGGSWGMLERAEHSALFTLFDAALGSDRFRHLTDFDLERDVYTLTLSLQDLQPAGIGWHRDLYWPKEWIGEDVFAVLYALGSDSPEKGGAFVCHHPEEDLVSAIYRQHHQATVMWNSRDKAGRLLHAVTGYHGDDTSRHMVILQCLRRQNAP